MSTSEQNEIVEIAEAIRRYLQERPNAAETAEGVARWWLARQRRDDTVSLAQQALNYLEQRGHVVKFYLAGGKVMYRRA